MLLSLFPSIFEHPEHVRFAEQEDDEKIELFLRQHGFVNIGWMLGSIIAVVLPVIIIQLDLLIKLDMVSKIPVQLVISGIVLYYLLVVAFVIEKFLHWYFNIYIVTNQHIVDINFLSLMYRQINEARLNEIQNVGSSVKGVFGPFLNYGDVVIETAGNTINLDFHNVPRPDLVTDRIQDLRTSIDHKGGV